jgi:hypothetical protein
MLQKIETMRVRQSEAIRRLNCVWTPTGNPRRPLACTWVSMEKQERAEDGAFALPACA